MITFEIKNPPNGGFFLCSISSKNVNQ